MNMTSVLYPEGFTTIPQDDRSYRSDDSGGEVFRNIPKNSSTFRIWKIEVIILSLVKNYTFNKKKKMYISYFHLSRRVCARQLSPEAT